jgi:hypothetical protein
MSAIEFGPAHDVLLPAGTNLTAVVMGSRLRKKSAYQPGCETTRDFRTD